MDRVTQNRVRDGLLRSALICLAAAFTAAPPFAAQAQTRTKVTAAYVGVVSDIGLYLADKKGYFRDTRKVSPV